MGIDYVIDYECVPKQELTSLGIMERLKAKQRAQAVIKLYRDRGDMRPPSEMGFEMVRRVADGSEEVQVIVVQDMLNDAAPLDSLRTHCAGCPANVLDKPFGCFNTINYPISQQAEVWLLKRLPTPEDPLIFLLVQQAVQDIQPNSELAEQIGSMRSRPGVFFQSSEVLGRRYDEMTITTNHIFQLLFLPESINPAYGSLLLLLFNAIPRDMDAEHLMQLASSTPDRDIPLLIEDELGDDQTLADIKDFLRAVHRAHALHVTLSLDA
ncbi:MAG: hypothetical protein KF716_05280 [Anaerolineae bacterium]|nr:hypothetical protein [Anaerolineae bacterium]